MNVKRTIIMLSLVAMLVLSACSANPSKDVGRTIMAYDTGKTYVTPDIAYVFVGVHSQAEKVTDALSQNNDQAQAVANALKGLGVEDKDIQTSAFNVYPQQQYGPNGENKGILYVVDNTVNITVRDLTKLGSILDAVVRSGANNINGISFDLKDRETAIAAARAQAIANARKQADEIAKAAGVTLGDLINVSTTVQNGPQPMYDAKGGGGAAMGASSVPVSTGQMLITVDASLTFSIK